jgi:alkylation response protein AidB-like acyl-CoA dehydrogenase
VQFALNSDQLLLKDAVDAFVKHRYGSGEQRKGRAEAAGYSADNWQALAEIGVLALPFSEEDGGLGSGPRELAIVLESLGGGLCVEPLLEEVVVAGGLLARAGTPAQKAAWLPRVIGGEAHLALAHFEHAARFALDDVQVRADSRGGRVVLSGEKSVVPLAPVADQWIVSARDDSGVVGFHLVAPGASGVTRRDFRMIDGAVASLLRFEATPTAGRLAGGLDDLAAVADVARVATGAEMIGVMAALFEATNEYLKVRQQFGQPIGRFQALQHQMADLYVLLEQSRSQLLRALQPRANGGGPRSVAGMKSYISRAAVEMGEACVHLHGGMGTTDELSIGHGYKRLLLLASLFGDANTELVRYNRLRDAGAAACT